MSNYCAYPKCKNNSKACIGSGVVFHQFPTKKMLCKRWIDKCHRGSDKSFRPMSHRICSEHFAEAHYERDLKAALLGLPPRKKLKCDAVPRPDPTANTKNERDIRMKRKEHARLIKTILEEEIQTRELQLDQQKSGSAAPEDMEVESAVSGLELTQSSSTQTARIFTAHASVQTIGTYGTPSSTFTIPDSTTSWIMHLSRGGLLIPNDHISNVVEKCETVFLKFMSEKIMLPNVTKNFVKAVLQDFPEFETKIVELFVATRVRIRLKELNINTKSKFNVKKAKQFIRAAPK